MSHDDKAVALRAAIEAALAAYNSEGTPPPGPTPSVTTRGQEVHARGDAPAKPTVGTARERARADYERRHPRRDSAPPRPHGPRPDHSQGATGRPVPHTAREIARRHGVRVDD